MTAATWESYMPVPEAMQEGPGLWGTIGASITAGLVVLYNLWGKMRTERAGDDTETEALKTVRAAVEQWKTLSDTAWAQVSKEREMRLAAEQRASLAVQEVEGLRGEVASLRREIEHLTATVAAYSKGAT